MRLAVSLANGRPAALTDGGAQPPTDKAASPLRVDSLNDSFVGESGQAGFRALIGLADIQCSLVRPLKVSQPPQLHYRYNSPLELNPIGNNLLITTIAIKRYHKA
jgi:hypothetical protein